jgi:polysaccharide pyruvyl transferase WcaK-like protein
VAPRLFPGLAARTFASRLAASDAVIMNAGGLLADHLAHYLPGRIFALAAAQMAGKPTALVNYSFAVTEPEILAWVAPIMRAVDLHAVRESHSRERLVALGVEPDRIVVVPDTAFAVDPPAPSQHRPEKQLTIALQVRGDRQADIAAWAELIRELRSRFDACIALLVGCSKYDPPVIASLRRESPVDVTAGLGGLPELREAIGKADILVTDRYHGAIFATQMGTPFIPLASTTLKTAGLVADLGYASEVYPPLNRQGIPAIMSAVGTALARRDSVTAQLLERADCFRGRLFADYADIVHRLLSPAGESQLKLE